MSTGRISAPPLAISTSHSTGEGLYMTSMHLSHCTPSLCNHTLWHFVLSGTGVAKRLGMSVSLIASATQWLVLGHGCHLVPG